jgi:Na+/melibiose symporter-like transporter
MLPTHQILSYGALGLPLAFIGLPIYVYVPKFYADQFGVSLTLIGTLLILARIVDTVQDPLIGWWSDRFAHVKHFRQKIILYSSVLLLISLVALFNPLVEGQLWVAGWMVVTLILVYTVYSVVMINYYAIAMDLSRDYNEQTRITASREGFTLIGILFVAVAQSVLAAQYGDVKSYQYLTIVFAALMVWPIYLLYKCIELIDEPIQKQEDIWRVFVVAFKNKAFRKLNIIYLVNGVASSIPATVVLFFIDDVLKAEAYTGAFLATYFLSGALGMLLWIKVSEKIGKKQTWLIAMAISIVTFVWAYSLGAGDIAGYFAICFLSGTALGADMAIPPSMLADVVGEGESPAKYFGIWIFISKLGLALAGGISFILLGQEGYESGVEVLSEQAIDAISAVYALLPCAIMLIAIVLLWKSDLDDKECTHEMG